MSRDETSYLNLAFAQKVAVVWQRCVLDEIQRTDKIAMGWVL